MAADVLVPFGKTGRGKLVERPLATALRHSLLSGTSGWGKTGLAISTFLAIRQRNPRVGWVILDPKADLAVTLRDEVLPALHDTPLAIPPEQVVTIDPFGRYSCGLNPLTPMAGGGVPVEAQAQIVTSVVSGLAMDGLGQRGAAILSWLCRALIPLNGSLADAVHMLRDDRFRRAVAERVVKARDVREYLLGDGGYDAEPSASVGALVTRLEWILTLPAARAALAAPGSVDAGMLLDTPAITIINTGGAPAGFSAAGRLISGFLLQKITAAIFARKVTDTTRPVVLVIDEAHEVLKAGGAVDDTERMLTMARARRVGVQLIVQDCSQLPPSIVPSLKANISWHAAFRPQPQDIKHLAGLLAITGRRVDPSRPDCLLSREDERRLLLDQINKLPPRHFVFADYIAGRLDVCRSLSWPQETMKARAAACPQELRDRFARGRLGVPVSELLAQAGKPVVKVADGEDADRVPEPAPRGRPRPRRPALELP